MIPEVHLGVEGGVLLRKGEAAKIKIPFPCSKCGLACMPPPPHMLFWNCKMHSKSVVWIRIFLKVTNTVIHKSQTTATILSTVQKVA